jgi:endonuclease III
MNKNIVIEIIEILKKTYPDAKCSLNFTTPFEMLIAVMLSAQCTDERVNKTTPYIFNKYNTPEAFTNIPIEDLEVLVHPCGFYKNKAKNIKLTSEKIIINFNGNVPQNMEDLMSLPGVGRKTANVVMLEAFNKPQGIAIDTHAKRICNKLGLSNKSTPEQIEQDLLKIIPQKYYKDINHLFIWHGRNICTARNPKCSECPVQTYCKNFTKTA